jgi:hypothetical protein
MEHAICYISTTNNSFTVGEIETLLPEWRENNNKENIKGILLFSEGNFFQVLEGEKTKVLELFQRIKEDPRHNNIIQVVGQDLSKGSFDHYIVEHLDEAEYSKPELVSQYCESVKGMDPETQQQIKNILKSFIDTRVL